MKRLVGERQEQATVYSMYGRVRVQFTVDHGGNSIANHFTRWEAVKLAGAILRKALFGRLS